MLSRYRNEIIELVDKAVIVYDEVFANEDAVLVHGDLHRYNIMSKNGQLLAIDPIGYIAPIEIDLARYIGTELTDTYGNKKEIYDTLIAQLSQLTTKEKLEAACFVDMVFRLHNSLFENEDYKLTDKWLNVIENIFD